MRLLSLAALLAVGCKGASPGGAVDAPASGDVLAIDAAADGPLGALTCNGSDPMVKMPDAVHGIFAYLPGLPVPSYTLNNPVVCGGNYLVDWSSIDQGGGVYDWTVTDNEINAWALVGKKTNLLVDADNFGMTDKSTPSYVVKPTGTVDTVDCYVAAVGTTPASGENGVPLFWEDDFVKAYETFIDAVITKYDANPNIGYIRFGMSNGAQTGTTVCFDQLVAAGLTQTIWEGYVGAIAAHEIGTPHTTQLMLGLGPYGTPNDPNDGTGWTQDSFPDWEAALVVPKLGIGNQGLEYSDITNTQNGKSCNGGDWCANFAKYAGQTPLYLQQVGGSCVIGTPRCQAGLLTDILPFAVAHDAQILEVYESDLDLAYDSSDQTTYNGEEATTYRAMFTQLATASLGSASP